MSPVHRRLVARARGAQPAQHAERFGGLLAAQRDRCGPGCLLRQRLGSESHSSQVWGRCREDLLSILPPPEPGPNSFKAPRRREVPREQTVLPSMAFCVRPLGAC